MASLEDYDEFGNYIGGDLDSDDEDDMQQDSYIPAANQESSHAPLEGFDDERPQGPESMALMEVDGELRLSFSSSIPGFLNLRLVLVLHRTRT